MSPSSVKFEFDPHDSFSATPLTLNLYCPDINTDTRQDTAENLQEYPTFRFNSAFNQLSLFPELNRNNLSGEGTVPAEPL